MKKVTANGLSKGEIALLYEFSMTPELFDFPVVGSDKRAESILIQVLRGIIENGLLANLGDDDNQWFNYVEKKRRKFPQKLKDQVRECLSTLDKRHRLIRRPKCIEENPSTDQDWLNLALDSHNRTPLYAIILSQELMHNSDSKSDIFIEFFDSLNSKLWNGRRRTLSVKKTLDDYERYLTPVLRYARSLKLIDPWLNPLELRYYNTLEICSRILGHRVHSQPSPRIDIHVAENKDNNQTIEDYFAKWKQKLNPLIGEYGHHFRIYLWGSGPNSESMHDRFILTDQCGISVPWGLDCLKRSNRSTDWSFLDEEVRLRRWGEYDPRTRPNDLIDCREYFFKT